MEHQIVGKGLQYTVYSVNESRVLKVETTRLQKLFILLSWKIFNPIKIWKQILTAEVVTKASIEELKRIPKINPDLIGNPIFIDHVNYEQDFALPLAEYFVLHTIEENKKAIDLYIENIIEIWKYGISDTVYNFTVNYGFKNGRVIILDLGEFTSNKLLVASQIQEKIWITQWSYKNLKDTALKEYVTEKLSEVITIGNLDKYWAISPC